MLKDSAF